MHKSNKAYEKRESKIISRIHRDIATLHRMQKGEVKKMKRHKY